MYNGIIIRTIMLFYLFIRDRIIFCVFSRIIKGITCAHNLLESRSTNISYMSIEGQMGNDVIVK